MHSPLDVVADIFSRSSSPSSQDASDDAFFQSVHEHFSSVLCGGGHLSSVRQASSIAAASALRVLSIEHVFEQIPRLENVNTRGKLVRFRCMVQDTGLANEVYVLDAHASSRASGGSRRSGSGCCAYSEGPAGGSPILDVRSCESPRTR